MNTNDQGYGHSTIRRSVHVYFIPSEFHVNGDDTTTTTTTTATAVVIDILRATTTMIHALGNGVGRLIPCETVEDAYNVRDMTAKQIVEDRDQTEGMRHQHPSRVLLGGERNGVKIDGFDLSNSPKDYVSDRIAGATIGFTTTNGTKALMKCRQLAHRVYIGAFCNLSSLTKRIVEDGGDGPVHIVCAGSDGQVAGEDVLFAGALCERLMQTQVDSNDNNSNNNKPSSFFIEDSSRIALCQWKQEMSLTGGGRGGDATISVSAEYEYPLRQALRRCKGGRGLIALGRTYEDDIDIAAQIDTHNIVGVYQADGSVGIV
jgi:2-phosphosulfolactate phosphatase